MAKFLALDLNQIYRGLKPIKTQVGLKPKPKQNKNQTKSNKETKQKTKKG